MAVVGCLAPTGLTFPCGNVSGYTRSKRLGDVRRQGSTAPWESLPDSNRPVPRFKKPIVLSGRRRGLQNNCRLDDVTGLQEAQVRSCDQAY